MEGMGPRAGSRKYHLHEELRVVIERLYTHCNRPSEQYNEDNQATQRRAVAGVTESCRTIGGDPAAGGRKEGRKRSRVAPAREAGRKYSSQLRATGAVQSPRRKSAQQVRKNRRASVVGPAPTPNAGAHAR